MVVERGGFCALGVCGLTDGADSFRSVCGLRREVLREARYWRVVLDRGAGCAYNVGVRKERLGGVRREASGFRIGDLDWGDISAGFGAAILIGEISSESDLAYQNL